MWQIIRHTRLASKRVIRLSKSCQRRKKTSALNISKYDDFNLKGPIHNYLSETFKLLIPKFWMQISIYYWWDYNRWWCELRSWMSGEQLSLTDYPHCKSWMCMFWNNEENCHIKNRLLNIRFSFIQLCFNQKLFVKWTEIIGNVRS